ncbi:hypothetical protein GCM10027612_69640 [Microbispora bryophytorum subsp. camponoti]
MTIPKLVLSSPADILAAVPYLVGFHPTDSLVVAGVAGPQVRLTTRWDLPVASEDLDLLVALLRREAVTEVFVVGYGPGALVTPAADTVTRLLRAGGIRVAESLRAEGGATGPTPATARPAVPRRARPTTPSAATSPPRP